MTLNQERPETSYLVHHHDYQKVANSSKEQAVQVVRRALTDLVTKHVEDNLANNKEEHAKNDISQRPAILQSVDDENDLHNQVDKEENGVEHVEHNKEPDGVGRP